MNLRLNSSFPWGSQEENERSLKRMAVDHALSVACSIRLPSIAQVVDLVGVSMGRVVLGALLPSHVSL